MSRGSSHKPERRRGPTILVFTEGTVIVHPSGVGLPREEIVSQVRSGEDASLTDFAHYVAIGEAPGKLRAWRRAGATIGYLTSRRTEEEVGAVRRSLRANRFPRGRLVFRLGAESYAEAAARVRPDILVEDDCESIGGEPEMTYPHLPARLRRQIRSVVVKEFGGIDHLPDDPGELRGGTANRRPGPANLIIRNAVRRRRGAQKG